MLNDNLDSIFEALHKDLNKQKLESYMIDIAGCLQEIIYIIEHVEQWAADKAPEAGFVFEKILQTKIRQDPLGVALIISAYVNGPSLHVFQRFYRNIDRDS